VWELTGKYEIAIKTKLCSYVLDIDRSLTILQGNSGAGKTTMLDYLNDGYSVEEIKENNNGLEILINNEPLAQVSNIKIITYNNNLDTSKIDNCIILIDERMALLKSIEDIINHSNSYFILISRSKLKTLSSSSKDIFELETNYSGNNKFITRMIPLHDSYKNNKKEENK
jgi:hypothetical protein